MFPKNNVLSFSANVPAINSSPPIKYMEAAGKVLPLIPSSVTTTLLVLDAIG